MVDYVPELGAVLRQLIALPRYYKRTLLVINDLALLTFAVWAAFSSPRTARSAAIEFPQAQAALPA